MPLEHLLFLNVGRERIWGRCSQPGRIRPPVDFMLILSCQGLSRGFDRDPLFEAIGFELHAGERVGLVGPNGCGKSTLMKILAGVDNPDTGSVKLHAGARLGFLTQEHDIVPGRTLIEEAREALKPLYQAQEEMVLTLKS